MLKTLNYKSTGTQQHTEVARQRCTNTDGQTHIKAEVVG